jgi:uncharacterized membrane protein YgdD (TMEM256/DUF423 family)
MLEPRIVAALGALLAALAVAGGAFGAHGLRGRLTPDDLAIFETAVRYHLIHALALFAVAWVMDRWPGGMVSTAAVLMVLGILVFSGSLYLLVLTGPRWLGAITPIGGVGLIAGWAVLAWHLLTRATS